MMTTRTKVLQRMKMRRAINQPLASVAEQIVIYRELNEPESVKSGRIIAVNYSSSIHNTAATVFQ